MQVDALIKELLATGTMNEETTADLNRWLAEHASGTLHPEDAAYIAALHAKINDIPLPEIEAAPPVEQRIDGLTAAEWRERALRAEAELADLKEQSTGV